MKVGRMYFRGGYYNVNILAAQLTALSIARPCRDSIIGYLADRGLARKEGGEWVLTSKVLTVNGKFTPYETNIIIMMQGMWKEIWIAMCTDLPAELVLELADALDRFNVAVDLEKHRQVQNDK